MKISKFNLSYVLYPMPSGAQAMLATKKLEITVSPQGKIQKQESKNSGALKLLQRFGIRGFFFFIFGVFYSFKNTLCFGKNAGAVKKVEKSLNVGAGDIILFFTSVVSLIIAIVLLGIVPIKLSFALNKSFDVFLKRLLIAITKVVLIYLFFLSAKFIPSFSEFYSFNGVCNDHQKQQGEINFLVYFVCSVILNSIIISFAGITANKWYFLLVNAIISVFVFTVNYEILKVLMGYTFGKIILKPFEFLVVKKPSQTHFRCVNILLKEIELNSTKRDKMTQDTNEYLFSETFVLAKQILNDANKFDESDLNCILSEITGKTRAELRMVKTITKAQHSAIISACRSRAKGEPVTKIFGHANFYGLDFVIDENVLSPRADTERLVETVLANMPPKCKVLDIGTGSGAIAITLAKLGNMNITALDVSPKALEIAKQNAKKNGVRVNFAIGNVLDGLKGFKKFNAIVSNPPYIKSEDIPLLDEEVKNYDPLLALDGGKSGYDFYEKIIEIAPNHLSKGGKIFFEVGINQAKYVKKLLQNNFKDITIVKDYNKIDRVVYATLK